MKTRSTLSGLLFGAASLALLSLSFAGCTGHTPSDQEIQEKSAQATRDARRDAKELAANAKVAAAQAVNGVNAVAAGVKDGMDGKPGDLVDINSASTARLALLPGLSLSQARSIVQDRPFATTQDLVTRGVITRKQYDEIAAKITAR